MKRDIQTHRRQAREGIGKGFWLLLGAVALLGVVLLAARARRSGVGDATNAPGSEPVADTASPTPSPEPSAARESVSLGETNPPPASTTDNAATVPKTAPVPPPRIPAPELPAPSAESRQLVAALWQMDPAAGPMTTERAAQWKQNFERLVQGGAASVPAIAEFLKLNKDSTFGAEGSTMLGYGSARVAMLDALVRIGGAEGIGALCEVLQTTAVPREIALVARDLETLAPGQYRAQSVEAVRQSLGMAVEKQLEGFDVAPLFEVLQQYRGS